MSCDSSLICLHLRQTHDESFLEILGGSGVLDKYFRVSRGDGGQVSKIERQRLT